MTLTEAKRLIDKGESLTVEFKRKLRHPEKVVKELVAFANTEGGYLFIGVNDDGALSGVPYPEDELYALNQAIEKYCRPPLAYYTDIVRLSEHKFIVVYEIPPSDKKPHFLKGNTEHPGNKSFVRVDDKSIKASRQVREILNRQRKNKDIQFNFGEHEKSLMDYLERHKKITLDQFKKLSGKNAYQASRTLILMVLANVLEVHPSDKEDFYTLKEYA